MKDIARLQNYLKQAPFEAKGHCRVDYTDPLTGRVLERIEGDNHVFTDQLLSVNFQNTALASSILLTNGDKELDTDLPYLPGTPIGYGTPSTSATGNFQGSYRSADSYINKIMRNQVTSLYVYDFLTTQIPDAIRYVGLTGAGRVGTATTPFSYRWPVNSFQGIYDIERMRLIYGGTCSLSDSAGGAGTMYCNVVDNVPGATSKRLDLFELCERPDNYWMWPDIEHINWNGEKATVYDYSRSYQTTWGYDYENQAIVVKLMRAHLFYYDDRVYNAGGTSYTTHRYYTYRFRDEFWVINLDGTEVLKHFSYTWDAIREVDSGDTEHWKGTSWQYYYHFWSGDKFPSYLRLYGDRLYGFSRQPENYGDTIYGNMWYSYQYDITSGTISCDKHRTNTRGNNTTAAEANNTIMGNTNILYCYKGYTWGNGSYLSDLGYGFTATNMGVIPMYDVYADDIYTQCPVLEYGSTGYYGYYAIEKGQSNIYAKTWNIKPYFSNFNPDTSIATCPMPFAYTAYQLPADAPERPKNSAVTIAYGLTVTW